MSPSPTSSYDAASDSSRLAGRAGGGIDDARAGGPRREGGTVEPVARRFTPSSFGRELQQLGDELVEEVHLAGVARDARHLLLDFDRLGRLPDLRERAGEQPERVEVARVGLEADLQLRERLHPVARGVPREVELGRGARVRRGRPCGGAGAR